MSKKRKGGLRHPVAIFAHHDNCPVDSGLQNKNILQKTPQSEAMKWGLASS